MKSVKYKKTFVVLAEKADFFNPDGSVKTGLLMLIVSKAFNLIDRYRIKEGFVYENVEAFVKENRVYIEVNKSVNNRPIFFIKEKL